MKQYKIISLLKIIQRCTLIFTFSSAQTLPRDVSSSKYVRIFIPTFAHSLSLLMVQSFLLVHAKYKDIPTTRSYVKFS